MPTYAVINDTEIDLDSPITESLMNRLRDNPLAIQEGDPSAPNIQRNALEDNIINQVKIDTSIGSVSLGVTSSTQTPGSNRTLLPGGQYGFYPTTDTYLIFGSRGACIVGLDSTSTSPSQGEQTRIGLLASHTGGGGAVNPRQFQCDASQRYINASAPYDMGDGLIDLFVFIYYRGNDILSVYAADAPPWAYNGKTNIAPDCFVKNTETGENIPYKAVWVNEPTPPWEGGDIAIYEAYQENPQMQLVEVTTDYKNLDMQEIPHPFETVPQYDESGNDITDASNDTYVLLDPISPIMKVLAAMIKNGSCMQEIIQSGKILIGDEIPERATPPGVIVKELSWGGA